MHYVLLLVLNKFLDDYFKLSVDLLQNLFVHDVVQTAYPPDHVHPKAVYLVLVVLAAYYVLDCALVQYFDNYGQHIFIQRVDLNTRVAAGNEFREIGPQILDLLVPRLHILVQ